MRNSLFSHSCRYFASSSDTGDANLWQTMEYPRNATRHSFGLLVCFPSSFVLLIKAHNFLFESKQHRTDQCRARSFCPLVSCLQVRAFSSFPPSPTDPFPVASCHRTKAFDGNRQGELPTNSHICSEYPINTLAQLVIVRPFMADTRVVLRPVLKWPRWRGEHVNF